MDREAYAPLFSDHRWTATFLARAPAANRFVAVADITDNPDPDAIDWAKEMWLGTPIWNPPVAQNVFQVADKELEVRMCGDVLTANLTVRALQ